MKLTNETIAILKNFSKIQRGCIIAPGNIIKVRTNAVYAEATVTDTFPLEIRLTDTKDFLRTVALFKDPELAISEDYIRIVEGDGTADSAYPQAKPGSLAQLPLPKGYKPVPPEHFTCTIKEEQWATLQKALGIGISKADDDWLRTTLTFVSDDGGVRVTAERKGSPTEYSAIFNTTLAGLEFKCVFDSAHLAMLVGSYEVTITPSYAKFHHRGNYSLVYFVGAEPNLSTWGGKRSYAVTATKSVVQDCQISIQARSPEEAEAIVSQKPDDAFVWTAERHLKATFKAVPR